MDELEEILMIKVSYENKNFEIKTEVNMTLEEIKKKFAEKINYNDNIDKINLWYIDEDKDKYLINNYIDLIQYSTKIDFTNNFIKLILEINNKDNNDNQYKKELKKNEIEEKKDENINNPNNINFNIKTNKLEDDKNKNIQKLINANKLLNNEISYYKNRIQNIIKYYENVLIKNKKNYEQNLNISLTGLVEENMSLNKKLNIYQNNISDNENKINKNNQNEINEEIKINNKNEINEIISQENNINQNEIKEKNHLSKSQTFFDKKSDKPKEKPEYISDKQLSQLIKKVENNKKEKEKKEKEKKEKEKKEKEKNEKKKKEKEKKEEENIFNLNDIEGETPIINNKLKENGKDYNFDNIEFINNKCNKCEHLCLKIIYKCVLCDNFFLCETCHKNNRKTKFHNHFDFFEIRYPNEVIRQMQEKINEGAKLKKSLASFYGLLNSIFFDKGEFLIKEYNKNDVKNLKQICKEMKSLNADPLEYFSEYKKTFINNQVEKLEEKSKELVKNKLKIFTVNLEESISD